MDEKDIRKLIASKEFQGMEWKTSLSEREKIGETVSAFANTNDGRILVGISPVGKIIGVVIGISTLEDLANFIKETTDTRIYPRIEEHSIDGKEIIEIFVEEATKKPIFFKGRAFQRVGRTNQTLSSDRIAELMSSSGKILHWDERICAGADLDDIDADKVERFLEKAKSERGSEINPGTPIEDTLERLDLIQNSMLTNAAILLFGKKPQAFFRQAKTKCGRFKGTEPIDFIDMKDFGGSIIEQRENAIEFVMEHIKLRAEVVGTDRIEEWEYPIEAIREAITNAICHRDYEESTNVQVRIFDDRVEIWGCGSLPRPLTVEDLKRSHRSIPRNPLIGDCFFRIRFIEQWGTGTNRIISACRDHGLPEPLFEDRPDGLVVSLRKITKKMVDTLPGTERMIVEFLTKNNRLSTKECASLLNVSRGTAQRHLSSLERMGIISRRGSGKGTYYVLSLIAKDA